MPNVADIKVLRVSAKAEGYRREGLKFGAATVNVPASLLSHNQIHRLMHDPMLNCEALTEEPEPFISAPDLAALRVQAAIGEAFLAKVPADFVSVECPSEYVTHLQDQVHELELAAQASKTAAHEAKPPTAANHGQKPKNQGSK